MIPWAEVFVHHFSLSYQFQARMYILFVPLPFALHFAGLISASVVVFQRID
jgi:hypothetical protein